MAKSKKQAIDNTSLIEQVEDYILECIDEFEYVSGLRVERIEVVRKRPIGFYAKPEKRVNVIIES